MSARFDQPQTTDLYAAAIALAGLALMVWARRWGRS